MKVPKELVKISGKLGPILSRLNPIDAKEIIEKALETYEKIEREKTKQKAIEATKEVIVQEIIARREIIEDYLAKKFKEREKIFEYLFKVVDFALEKDNLEALRLSLQSIVEVNRENPLDNVFSSKEKTLKALKDPNHVWKF